jgi:hypothetical protein
MDVYVSLIGYSNATAWDLIVLFTVSILLMNGAKRERSGGITLTGSARKTRLKWAEIMPLSFLSSRMSLKLQSTDKALWSQKYYVGN